MGAGCHNLGVPSRLVNNQGGRGHIPQINPGFEKRVRPAGGHLADVQCGRSHDAQFLRLAREPLEERDRVGQQIGALILRPVRITASFRRRVADTASGLPLQVARRSRWAV